MKRKLSISFIITLFMVNIIFVFQPAQAAENFQVESFPYSDMQIQVMPEFDNPAGWNEDEPSLLVGYYGTIVNKSGNDYDGVIEFPIPLDTPDFQLYLAAEFQETDQPEVQLAYEIDQEKGVVSWKPTKPIKKDESYQFVIEYYANPFTVAEQKSFTFHFEAESIYEKIDVLFLAPFNSEEFTVDKEGASISKSEYGEEIYQYGFKDVKAGGVYDFVITYKKGDNKPTLAVINSGQIPNDDTHAGVQSGESATDSQGSGSKNAPIIDTIGAIIIGFAIIIAGVIVFLGFKKSNKNNATIHHQNGSASENLDKSEQKKKLRQQLLQGEIDQQTYDDEMKKLY